MAGRLVYEEEDGRMGKVAPPGEGTILFGGNRIQWKRLEASVVPYNGQNAGALANVSMALDHLVALTDTMRSKLEIVDQENQRIDGQQTDMLDALRNQIADLNRALTEAQTTFNRTSHAQTGVSLTSNPALSIETQRQVLKLDFNAKGSFDDSRAGLGVNTIQLAIETLAGRLHELVYSVNALRETLAKFEGE